MIIYKVINKKNGKVYIGQTKQTLPQRRSAHYYNSNHGSETNFHRALRKYEKWNWNWEILENCNTEEELTPREIYFIAEYNTYKTGYNMTTGGDGGLTYRKGDVLYERIKHKLGKWKHGNPGSTPEAISKRVNTVDWSAYPKGKNHANYGTHPKKPSLVGEGNPMWGKTPTNARQVEVDGIVYDSLSKCARETGISHYIIRKRIKNNTITNYKYKN